MANRLNRSACVTDRSPRLSIDEVNNALEPKLAQMQSGVIGKAMLGADVDSRVVKTVDSGWTDCVSVKRSVD